MKFEKIVISIRESYHLAGAKYVGRLTWLYLIGALVAFTLLVAAFVALADEVIEGETLAYDTAMLEGLRAINTPALDSFVSVATDAGGVVGVVGIMLVAVAVLAYQRKYRAVLQLLAGVGGAAIINVVLKSIFARSRPDLWEQIISETSYSFPSGHAMASSALAFSLILLLWRTRWRWWVVGGTAVYMVFVGLSRTYLGVHYPSDILAGWLVSGAWVLTVAILVGTVRVRAEEKSYHIDNR